MQPIARVPLTARPNVLEWLAAGLVLAVGLLLINPLPLGVMRDDAMYVVLAKSLATGHGYRWLNVPGMPAATHFPPGYPAVLSALWLLFPRFPANVIAFKTLNAVLAAIIAFMGARFARTRLGMSPTVAFITATAGALSLPVLALTTTVMSEPLFLALVFATLLVAERAVAEESSLPAALLAGALAGATTLVRTNGIAIVAAVVLVFLLRRRIRHALAAAAMAAMFVVPWLLFSSMHDGIPPAMRGNYGSYSHWLFDALRANGPLIVVQTIKQTSSDIAAMLGDITAPLLGVPGRVIGVALVLAVLAAGAAELRRRAPITLTFLALYLLITVLWPFSPARFVSCVWPLVLLVAVLGARTMLAWRMPRAAHGMIMAGLGALALGYASYSVAGYLNRSWYTGPESQARAMRPIVMWVARNTGEGEVLATNYEYSVYLYAKRLAVPAGSFSAEQYVRSRTQAEDVEGLRQILLSYRPAVVVVSTRRAYAAARSLVDSRPPILQPRAEFDGGAAFAAVGPSPNQIP